MEHHTEKKNDIEFQNGSNEMRCELNQQEFENGQLLSAHRAKTVFLDKDQLV